MLLLTWLPIHQNTPVKGFTLQKGSKPFRYTVSEGRHNKSIRLHPQKVCQCLPSKHST